MPQHFQTMTWQGDANGSLRMVDQTLLPVEFREITCDNVESVFEAIQMLRIRGAPAIGVAAAYGIIIGLQCVREADSNAFDVQLSATANRLASSRPTAVNLFWAIDRMKRAAAANAHLESPDRHDQLLQEAASIDQEDKTMCNAIGQHGQTLLNDGDGVLTHCNAGALATAGQGTALAVMYAAAEAGKQLHVFADETRPLLQGARLTAWELQQRGIAVTVICDNMAAQVMKEGRIQAVVTGADRIAANGDAANKIGTYGVAVLAQYHGIPFYVTAPSSTFDLSLASGDSIPIEQRSRAEVASGFGKQTVPDGVDVYNPAFDVTPASLITAIITEHGIIRTPAENAVKAHLRKPPACDPRKL
jgi:methylthioribose-1-phosphate isomerase